MKKYKSVFVVGILSVAILAVSCLLHINSHSSDKTVYAANSNEFQNIEKTSQGTAYTYLDELSFT